MKFLKKLENIVIHPYSTIRYWLMIKFKYDDIFKRKFDKKYKILKYFLGKDKENKMYPPEYHDLDNLIVTILKIKPKMILELGGGYSTIAITYALAKNFEEHGVNGKLYSYDQSYEYLELTKKLIPEQLKSYVEFFHSDLVVKKLDNYEVSIYKSLKVQKYDLVYEDRYDKHLKTRIVGDVLDMYKKNDHLPSIIFDGHWTSVYFYQKKFNNAYNISINKIFKRANFIRKNNN